MSKYRYHSALKIGLEVLEDVEPLLKFELNGQIGLKHDFVEKGLPDEMKNCQIIYGECPWPSGFKIFDERAGISERSFKTFQEATAKMIQNERRPIFLILGKILLNALPKPTNQAQIKLNKGEVTLAWWNCQYEGPLTINTQVTNFLGRNYKTIGDFCCGYGEPLFHFLDNSQEHKFVGSDHNGKCIKVLYERLKKRIENLP